MFYNDEKSGIPFSGIPLDPNASGSLDTGIFPDGYGQVYGIYWNQIANPSVGLAPHSYIPLVNTSPGPSGTIYWPAPIPYGQEIYFGFSGITYYDESYGNVCDESGILGGNNQMVLNIIVSTPYIEISGGTALIPIQDPTGDDIIGMDGTPIYSPDPVEVFVPAPLDIGSQFGSTTGFFLTTERFISTGNWDTFQDFLSSLNITNPQFTGYIAYNSGFDEAQEFDGGGKFDNYLDSGILTTPIEHSDFFRKSFHPQIVQDNLEIGIVSGEMFSISCWRVTGFFSGFQERLGDHSRMFWINQPVSQYCIFFTGYDQTGNVPLYLTYIQGGLGYSGIDPIQDPTGDDIEDPTGGDIYSPDTFSVTGVNDLGQYWEAISYFNFTPVISEFEPPSGVLLHVESSGLLPNYGMPTSDEFPSYEIERGGTYPSLADANGMNIYVNLIWQANCGDAINCQ